MKFDIPTDWMLHMARMEASSGEEAQFGAGSACARDVWFEEISGRAKEPKANQVTAFGKIVSMMRHERGLSVQLLAKRAHIDEAELLELESGLASPQPMLVHRLAEEFSVPSKKFMEVAGLVTRRGSHLKEAAVRFAASGDPSAKLTEAEREAWEAFVRELSK
jgi:transcriptional regulator with XRE-family HTH domain